MERGGRGEKKSLKRVSPPFFLYLASLNLFDYFFLVRVACHLSLAAVSYHDNVSPRKNAINSTNIDFSSSFCCLSAHASNSLFSGIEGCGRKRVSNIQDLRLSRLSRRFRHSFFASWGVLLSFCNVWSL